MQIQQRMDLKTLQVPYFYAIYKAVGDELDTMVWLYVFYNLSVIKLLSAYSGKCDLLSENLALPSI